MPVIGGGSFRLYSYSMGNPSTMVDGATLGLPYDPDWLYILNTGPGTVLPCEPSLFGPFILDTTDHGTGLSPGAPPPGFTIRTRPIYIGPVVRPGSHVMTVNNEGTWTMAGVGPIWMGVGGSVAEEQSDPLLTYIQLLNPPFLHYTRLDGAPGEFYSFPKNGTIDALVGEGPSIEGGYDIIAWWWTRGDKDSCQNDQTSRYVLSADQPPSGDDGGPFHKLDPDDIDAAPTPTIDAVEPNHGPVAGGDAIAIIGSGFGDGATVEVGGLAATFVVVKSQYRIECVVPAHAAGPVSVQVTNLDGVTT